MKYDGKMPGKCATRPLHGDASVMLTHNLLCSVTVAIQTPTTSAAPVPSKSEAHALIVAPVVTTSSTSATTRPRTSTTAVKAYRLARVPYARRVSECLLRSRARQPTARQRTAKLKSGRRRNSPRKLLGLVEAMLTPCPPRTRAVGNQRVLRQLTHKRGCQLCGKKGESVAVADALVVIHKPVDAGVRIGRVVARELYDAAHARPGEHPLCAAAVKHRTPADLARLELGRFKRTSAVAAEHHLATDGVVGQQLTAADTRRRKQQPPNTRAKRQFRAFEVAFPHLIPPHAASRRDRYSAAPCGCCSPC